MQLQHAGVREVGNVPSSGLHVKACCPGCHNRHRFVSPDTSKCHAVSLWTSRPACASHVQWRAMLLQY